jgi:hypothetical protein
MRARRQTWLTRWEQWGEQKYDMGVTGLLVFPVTCTPRLRAHRQNLDFYPTNTTLSLNIFIIEKDIEEALVDLET